MQRSFMRPVVTVLLISFSAIPTNVSAQALRVCSGAKPGYARCHAIVTPNLVQNGPRGYSPAGFRAAYGRDGRKPRRSCGRLCRAVVAMTAQQASVSSTIGSRNGV